MARTPAKLRELARPRQTIEFSIPYEVQPKQSMRAGIVNGKIRTWQPSKVTRNANRLALHAALHRPPAPLDGPLFLFVTFRWPWPKSAPKWQRDLGRYPRDTKPDFDNCCKQVCDVLETAGYYLNDSQIAEATIRKVWADQGGIEIIIGECEQ